MAFPSKMSVRISHVTDMILLSRVECCGGWEIEYTSPTPDVCLYLGVFGFAASWLDIEGIELAVGLGRSGVWIDDWSTAGRMTKAPSPWGLVAVRMDWVCVR